MLAELVDRLVVLGRKSTDLCVSTHPSLPRIAFVTHGETMKEVEVPPPLLHAELEGLDDVIALAGDGERCANPEVWVHPEGIRVLLDREDRRESAWCPLVESRRWRMLVMLRERGDPISVGEAVRLLRFELYGASTAGLLTALRSVDFLRTSAGANVHEHGREALGKSIEASVQQRDSIPDEIEIEVPRYVNQGLAGVTVPVKVGIHLDLEREGIVIQPLADQLELASRAACRAIGEKLRGQLAGVPVLHGAP